MKNWDVAGLVVQEIYRTGLIFNLPCKEVIEEDYPCDGCALAADICGKNQVACPSFRVYTGRIHERGKKEIRQDRWPEFPRIPDRFNFEKIFGPLPRPCVVCGTTFQPKRVNSRCCGAKCSRKLYKK